MEYNKCNTSQFDKNDVVCVFPVWKIAIVTRVAMMGQSYYKILEIVTPDGLYIEWDGLYDTLNGAVQRVEKVMSGLPWSA